MTQISVAGVAAQFGARTVFDDVTFTVAAGERWGVIGRNGTGKTTLFNLMTGAASPSRGVISQGPRLRVALLEQSRDFGSAATVWEAAAGSFEPLRRLELSLAEQAASLGGVHGEQATAQMMERYAHDLERFEREGGYTFAARVDAVLHGLGFDPGEARTRSLTQLSGGERGRLGLARQLAAPADVLLLDEPTNHLDLETTRWLEDYLRGTSQTVLVISHDRAFLADLVDHVLHFENGTAKPYGCGYEEFVRQRTERRLSQQRAYDKQRQTIDAEEDYIRRNIAGQNSKQAKGRRKRLERLPRLSPPPANEDAMSLRFSAGERGGDQVLAAREVTVAVEGRLLIEDLTGYVRRGDRVGMIGPNGAGKTTLLRAITGDLSVIAGELKLGSSVSVAYYRQDLAQVPTGRSLYDIIGDLRPTWERGQIQGHLGRFGFSGDDAQRHSDSLSGGEQARVALAMMMLSRANLLILDEPTNHLDVESIEALEDAVEAYDGTVMLVSHDRALLRALATRVWELRDGRMVPFDGSFADWEMVRDERREADRAREQQVVAVHRNRDRQRSQRHEQSARQERDAVRRAKRAVELAESEVHSLEAKVAELTALLADPALYSRPEGVKQAAQIATDLEQAKRALDRAIDEWSAATERVDALCGP